MLVLCVCDLGVNKRATTLPYENNGMSGALNMVDGLVVEVNLRM